MGRYPGQRWPHISHLTHRDCYGSISGSNCVLLVAEYRGVGDWSVMIGPPKVAAEGLEKKGLVGTSWLHVSRPYANGI